MPELAYVNEVFGPTGEARVSIEDRGFQFADGVYEVIVSYDGRLFRLEQHLERLQRSCDGIQMPFDVAVSGLAGVIAEGVRRSGFPDAMAYVQVTRGAGPRSHQYSPSLTPTVVATFRPRPITSARLADGGASVRTVPDERWSNCHIKSIALLPNVLAKNAAARDGFDDALFVGPDGDVREATTANVFMVKAGQLVTPPCSNRILHGVTRAYILECAARAGIPFVERPVQRAELTAADEIFLSNTTAEILPVTKLDAAPVGAGGPGPITRALQDAFRAGIRSAG